MNLTQALLARWQASLPLDEVLPVQRVYTGWAGDSTRPLARLTKVTARPTARFNDGARVEAITVRFEILVEDYETALTISTRLLNAFDQSSFALADGEQVLAMHNVEQSQEQQPDGAWQMTADFECLVLRS